MNVNVFEGARRAAVIVSILGLVLAAVLALTTSPYVSVNYRVDSPGAVPVWSDQSCPPDGSRSEYVTASSAKGRLVNINLCLLSMQFPASGSHPSRRLVPYTVRADGTVYGNDRYSLDVQNYAEQAGRNFQLLATEAKRADRIYEGERLNIWLESAKWLLICLAVFWAAVWAIGWTVRGFAGIPRGKDSRQPQDSD